MTILTVGPGQQYARLADAIAASRDGDTIRAQAGTYVNDFATISKRITIEGVGGMVKLVATRDAPNGKAILTTTTDVTLKNIELSGATASAGNGAAIRHENGALTLNSVYIHHNQNGILAGANPNSSITVSNSEFAFNGAGDGQTHGLYAGQIKSLTIRDSYFHDTSVGHEIKSRAYSTVIENSRIMSGPNGTDSYAVDLPNGGAAVLRNNVIVEGAKSDNPNTIHYGGEAGPHAGSSLLISGNTFVNDRSNANLLLNQTGVVATLSENKVYGFKTNQISQGPASVSGTLFLGSRPTVDTSAVSFSAANPPQPAPVPTPAPAPTPISGNILVGTTEAEKLSLSGFTVETHTQASAGQWLKTTGTGTASGVFGGSNGIYRVSVSYLDENDGTSAMSLVVNGQTVKSWSASVNDDKLHSQSVEVSLKNGDKIAVKGTANVGEYSRIDRLVVEAVPTPKPTPAPVPTLISGNILVGTTEAEKLSLSGFTVEAHTQASAGQWLKTTGTGTASGVFGGSNGVYRVSVSYLDESDGTSAMSLVVNGQTVKSWSASVNDDKLHSQSVEVSLKNGDKIAVKGTANVGEYSRIDRLVVEATPTPALQEADTADHAPITLSTVAGDLTAAGPKHLLSETDSAAMTLRSGGGGGTLLAGSGNARLVGTAGQDYSTDADGNNVFKAGANVMYEGQGTDLLMLSWQDIAQDVIAGFLPGTDHVKLTGTAPSGVTATSVIQGATTEATGNALLHLGNDHSVTLQGVGVGQLSQGVFS